MINAKKTLEKYKVDPQTLAPTSTQLVCWQCEECGSERDYSYAYCLRKQEMAKAKNSKEICQKCAHAHRKGKASQTKNPDSFLPLPPEVDAVATMERFGHDPYKLAPWSRKRVVVKCQVTGKICTPRRSGLNRYKSIVETGHFVSIGAWTAGRRKGVKASTETKEAMKKSQQARRTSEKLGVSKSPQSAPVPQPPTAPAFRPEFKK